MAHFKKMGYEIERDVLLNMMYEAVKSDVEFIYDESITGLQEIDDRMYVTFKNGSPQTYDLVFGCDGIHSAVRRYWFGAEATFSQFPTISLSLEWGNLETWKGTIKLSIDSGRRYLNFGNDYQR